jgi:hypothetical protein
MHTTDRSVAASVAASSVAFSLPLALAPEQLLPLYARIPSQTTNDGSLSGSKARFASRAQASEEATEPEHAHAPLPSRSALRRPTLVTPCLEPSVAPCISSARLSRACAPSHDTCCFLFLCRFLCCPCAARARRRSWPSAGTIAARPTRLSCRSPRRTSRASKSSFTGHCRARAGGREKGREGERRCRDALCPTPESQKHHAHGSVYFLLHERRLSRIMYVAQVCLKLPGHACVICCSCVR